MYIFIPICILKYSFCCAGIRINCVGGKEDWEGCSCEYGRCCESRARIIPRFEVEMEARIPMIS